MNKQYNTLKNLYGFSNLNNETHYKCEGGSCTCKYLDLNTNNRTAYDLAQKEIFKSENGTDYQSNMFERFKTRL